MEKSENGLEKMAIIQIARRRLQTLGVIKMLSVVHWALITSAGSLVVYCAFSKFSGQFEAKPIVLVLLIEYVVLDLLRLPFLGLSTISLGFPIIIFSLLIDYPDAPFAALLIATAGSFVSEALYCGFIARPRPSWPETLRRILFYTGHHAIAGAGALITYVFACCYVPRWLVEMLHIPATLIYAVTYSLISMLLVRTHDVTRLLLARDERPFVRADLRMTL